MNNKSIFVLIALLLQIFTVQAQQFNSVPLSHESYKVIEKGVLLGIISPPPSAKPWSEFVIKEKLLEMQENADNKLKPRELDIVSDLLASFQRKTGIDYKNGKYSVETEVSNQRISVNAGLDWESNFAVSIPDPSIATVNRGTFLLDGDMGNVLSWNFIISAGFLKIDREALGTRPEPPYIDPKFGPYDGNPNSEGHIYAYDIPTPPGVFIESTVYRIPAYFPYAFSKPWEAAVFPPKELGDYISWPEKFSFFYEMFSELNTSFFNNHLYLRFGRMRRDWGPEENGSSLFLNAMARPFMAFEGTAVLLPWLRFSFLTGGLEYLNNDSQRAAAEPYQNMLSLALLEFDTGRHFHLDFGSSALYAKRMELGYIFPLYSNFFYQNNSGDFDNMAMYGNMEFRFSGIKIWASGFIDEIRPEIHGFFSLNRNMYAYQGGVKAHVTWLPFGTFTMRYTKIEPYNYTHEYRHTPWLRVPMDTAYLNNGECIGFYLPPNSDELLARFEAMPLRELTANIQYQLVRHGADWGSRRVEGSSLHDKIIKNQNTQKYFLRDGAYQWDHVIKLGGTYTLKTAGVPVSFYADTGIVITRFTNSDAELGKEGNFSSIDTTEYRASNHFIFSFGFKVFP